MRRRERRLGFHAQRAWCSGGSRGPDDGVAVAERQAEADRPVDERAEAEVRTFLPAMCAAFFIRVSPASRSAKPACMNMTNMAATTTRRCWPRSRNRRLHPPPPLLANECRKPVAEAASPPEVATGPDGCSCVPGRRCPVALEAGCKPCRRPRSAAYFTPVRLASLVLTCSVFAGDHRGPTIGLLPSVRTLPERLRRDDGRRRDGVPRRLDPFGRPASSSRSGPGRRRLPNTSRTSAARLSPPV